MFTIDEAFNTWAVGFDMEQWDDKQFTPGTFDNRRLKVGQEVTVALIPDDKAFNLFVFVDGKLAGSGPKGIPADKDYRGAIDLIGNCDAVSFVPFSEAPAEAMAMVRSKIKLPRSTGARTPGASSRASSVAPADESVLSDIGSFFLPKTEVPRLKLPSAPRQQ
jgi:hypothetical protein